MSDPERTATAEQLLGVIFSMRPDNGPAGQAWALSIATTALSRAILASVGPSGDPSTLIELSQRQVSQQISDAQSKYIRDTLTVAGRS